MPAPPPTRPIDDSVPKQGDIAIGEDLEFQRRWWKFERGLWRFFFLLIVADVLGLFGRGWLADAKQTDAGHTVTLNYERVERASTPSILTFHFTPAAVAGGSIKLYVSEAVIQGLGAQRISPQPESSVLGNGGITYTFPTTAAPATAEIQLQPSFPGVHHFRVAVVGNPNTSPIEATVLVLP